MPRGICELCQIEKNLRDSHFMPKAIFKQLRMPTLKNPNPVLITPENTKTTSRHITDFVLCNDCEQRFSKLGESWVLANMARTGDFPLQEALISAGPMEWNQDFAIFSGAAIPAIDMDALTYFGMSIFWRAAAHEWKNDSGPMKGIDLDEYQEPIRRFLLGNDFPTNAVILVAVWPKLEAPLLAYTPRKGEAPGYEAFNFMIPGIEFRLLLGENVPAALKERCSRTSLLRCIFSASTMLTETRETFISLASNSKVSENLKRDWL
jgi:hypothetical protein